MILTLPQKSLKKVDALDLQIHQGRVQKLVQKIDDANTKLEQLTDEANGSNQERVQAPLDMQKLQEEEEKGSFDEWYVNYRCAEMKVNP